MFGFVKAYAGSGIAIGIVGFVKADAGSEIAIGKEAFFSDEIWVLTQIDRVVMIKAKINIFFILLDIKKFNIIN
jgi:hypothetical protein